MPTSPPPTPGDAELRLNYLAARRFRYKLAREDPNVFAEVVLRDEMTARRIEQAPHHRAWHALLDKHKNVVIWAHVEAGKTSQIIGRGLWELGRDPTLRIAIVSNTFKQAAKPLNSITKYIETSDDLHTVFPKLVKSTKPKDPWTENAITVERPTIAKDPSIQAVGLHGAIVGSRVDLLILDDILDFENTFTKAQRQKTWDWLQASLHGRLTARSRVWVVGTAFHREDALHRYANLPGYTAMRYPVLDDAGNPRWPEHWSYERIVEKRKTMTPAEYNRQLLCIARDDASSRFKMEWLDGCLERGRGKSLAFALKRIPAGCVVITGVDVGVSKRDKGGKTVLFTIIVKPNGDRELLNIEAGQWSGPDTVQKILEHYHRYQTTLFLVENNATQQLLIDFTSHLTDVPIQGFTTGANKANPEIGIESLAIEFGNSKWIIPNEIDADSRLVLDDEVRAWIDEILDYDPSQHTGDRLMASWFAREGVARSKQHAEQGRLDTRSR